MFISNLNTYIVADVLSFLSEHEVALFSEDFPNHIEATNSYWKKRRLVNLDEMTINDIEAFLLNIEKCITLRKLKFTTNFDEEDTDAIFNAMIGHLPSLEDLDISKILLTADRAAFLKFCDNLKSLMVNIPVTCEEYPLRGLFSDKTQLEHLRVTAGIIGQIKNSAVSFLEALVESQSSLKSFEIDYGEENTLGRLFSKNQHLEDVALQGVAILGPCLRYLTKNMKRLDIYDSQNIQGDILVQCLRNWNLESLCIDSTNASPTFIWDLVEAAPTLQHLTMVCGNHEIWNLRMLKELKKLKTLQLSEMRENQGEELRRITDSCVELELMDIAGEELTFTEELFASIAALPKLKEITICAPDALVTDINAMMRRLSRSQSLTDVHFICCDALTSEAVLTLIRGSNILTKLKLTGHDFPPELVHEINEVVAQQKSRTNILNLTFSYDELFSENILDGGTHPLLKVNIVN